MVKCNKLYFIIGIFIYRYFNVVCHHFSTRALLLFITNAKWKKHHHTSTHTLSRMLSVSVILYSCGGCLSCQQPFVSTLNYKTLKSRYSYLVMWVYQWKFFFLQPLSYEMTIEYFYIEQNLFSWIEYDKQEISVYVCDGALNFHLCFTKSFFVIFPRFVIFPKALSNSIMICLCQAFFFVFVCLFVWEFQNWNSK